MGAVTTTKLTPCWTQASRMAATLFMQFSVWYRPTVPDWSKVVKSE